MLINCKGKLLDLSQPKIMGILNVTQDSFYDGGAYFDLEAALRQADKMLAEGADILDIGAMSTRPGANIISPEEELSKVLPVLEAILQKHPKVIISIDTIHAQVAEAAIVAGAALINDVSAWNIDEKLLDIIAQYQVPYVLMHMKGKPADMQSNPSYSDIIQEIMDFFVLKLKILRQHKVKDIILDLGFGFGKSLEDNYHLLANLHQFQLFDLPILTGISRKSMIYKALDINPQSALSATSALHLKALQEGSKILRVHDVKEAKEVLKLHYLLENNLASV